MVKFSVEKIKKVQIDNLETELGIKEHEIFLIYSGKKYIGCLQWEKPSWNSYKNIVREYVQDMSEVDDVCEPIFKKNPCVSVPILSTLSEDNTLYFAHKDVSEKEDVSLNMALTSLIKSKSDFLVKELSRYEGVCLLGNDSINFKLKKVLEQYKISVIQEKPKECDSKWIIVDEKEIQSGNMKNILLRAAQIEHLISCFEVRNQLRENGIPVVLMAFPVVEDMELEEGETLSMVPSTLETYTPMRISANEEHTLYLCGPCIVSGFGLERDRLPELIYDEIKKYDYKVETIYADVENGFAVPKQVAQKEFKEKDFLMIVTCMKQDTMEKYAENIDVNLTDFFRKRSIEKPWFFDSPIHTTCEGNLQLIQYLKPTLMRYVSEASLSKMVNGYKQIKTIILGKSEKDELESYFRRIKNQCFTDEFAGKRKIGAIVMNCNPFTNGHKYLIEQARKEVDGLYIFVVEDNKSTFPFKDRFELVKEGCRCNEDELIKVIPSGQFILSSRTFASYFAKESLQQKKVDASLDISFFGQFVAPRLGIDIRFVGEEPYDTVTRQYNEEMKNKFHYYGIEVREIPRMKVQSEKNKEIVSASKVRSAWKENDWDLIRKMVPNSTYRYLKSKDINVILQGELERKKKGKVLPKRAEQLEQIRELIDVTGMAILYGIGKDAEGIVSFLSEQEKKKVLFCDKKALSQTKVFENVSVITPSELFAYYSDKGVYITSTLYGKEIFEELMDGGIQCSHIIFNQYTFREMYIDF